MFWPIFSGHRQSFPMPIEWKNQTFGSDRADKSDWSDCSTMSDRMEIRLHRTNAASAAEICDAPNDSIKIKLPLQGTRHVGKRSP